MPKNTFFQNLTLNQQTPNKRFENGWLECGFPSSPLRNPSQKFNRLVYEEQTAVPLNPIMTLIGRGIVASGKMTSPELNKAWIYYQMRRLTLAKNEYMALLEEQEDDVDGMELAMGDLLKVLDEGMRTQMVIHEKFKSTKVSDSAFNPADYGLFSLADKRQRLLPFQKDEYKKGLSELYLLLKSYPTLETFNKCTEIKDTTESRRSHHETVKDKFAELLEYAHKGTQACNELVRNDFKVLCTK